MNVSLTILINATSNYGESLGNISAVQKVFRGGKTYASRTRESLKNAIMTQSKLYEDLQSIVDKKVNQKAVTETLNASNCKALEGGYLNTTSDTVKRNSSFYLTDAVSCEPYVIETRFHNNLGMAENFAKQNDINLQKDASACGLMIYQYEYDKDLKIYSVTIDLDMIGKDENFNAECDAVEKFHRVESLLDTIAHLSLVVKGNLDNAEPLFVVGGLVKHKTHHFENVVNIKNKRLVISEDLKDKLGMDCHAGVLETGILENEAEVIDQLQAKSITKFFTTITDEVKQYYGV